MQHLGNLQLLNLGPLLQYDAPATAARALGLHNPPNSSPYHMVFGWPSNTTFTACPTHRLDVNNSAAVMSTIALLWQQTSCKAC
jgi:hypothetical protein